MNTTVTFTELEHLINNLAGTNGAALRDYVELDPTSPVIKLRIKPEVAVEGLPPGYDVDQRLNEALQDLLLVNPQGDTAQIPQDGDDPANLVLLPGDALDTPKSLDAIRVLVEGDSWCRLPEIPGIFLLPRLFPKAIGTQLQHRPGLEVKNIAHWGDTLGQIYQRKEYLTVIDSFQPQYFLLSAGGNDLQVNLRNIVHPYHPSRAVNDYLNPAGHNLLVWIRDTYAALIREVLARKPDVKILVYGYDYPKPTEESQYIGQHLTAKHIPEERMRGILSPMMDLLNQRIQEAAAQFPQVTFINCRGLTQDGHWFDDMHPNTAGYTRIVDAFVVQIR